MPPSIPPRLVPVCALLKLRLKFVRPDRTSTRWFRIRGTCTGQRLLLYRKWTFCWRASDWWPVSNQKTTKLTEKLNFLTRNNTKTGFSELKRQILYHKNRLRPHFGPNKRCLPHCLGAWLAYGVCIPLTIVRQLSKVYCQRNEWFASKSLNLATAKFFRLEGIKVQTFLRCARSTTTRYIKFNNNR